MTEATRLGQAAEAYASHGWHVFPLKPKSKEPLFKGGVHDATVNLPVIRDWWKRNPSANIGIALLKSKLACIDLDVKPDKGVNGCETYAGFAAIYGEAGSVAQQHTAGGGCHLLVRANPKIVDRVKWAEGIDILTARHRYIVAAPSVLDGGRNYAWHADQLEPWDAVGALTPAWARLLRAERPASEQRQPSQVGAPDTILDRSVLRVPGVDIAELSSILGTLKPEMGRDDWLRVLWGAAAQWSGTRDETKVIAMLEAWSARTTKADQHKPGEVALRWAEHVSTPGGVSGAGHVTWRSVRAMARTAGWSPFSLGGVDPARWKSFLKWKTAESGKKVVRGTAWNAALLLAYADSLKGAVKRNALTGGIEMHKNTICPLRDPTRLPVPFNKDADWIGISEVLASKMELIQKTALVDAVAAAADVHRYDPIKQWIDSLEWDGIKRLDTWLPHVTGCANTVLHRAIGRSWLIGLAARATADVDSRGAKMDSVLILQGPEGVGKSSVGAILGGDWYASFSNSLNNDEIYYTLEKCIVLEFDELDAMSRSDATRIKSLVTTQADTFRRKYDPTAQTKPRRCVFLGTTNEVDFLSRDMTMRRWWVVPTGRTLFNLNWLSTNRTQLIAEARIAFERGELPLLPTSLHQAHRAATENFMAESPYEIQVREWTKGKAQGTTLGMKEAIESALGRTPSSVTVWDLRRFAEAMRVCGWLKIHTNRGNFWRLQLVVPPEPEKS